VRRGIRTSRGRIVDSKRASIDVLRILD
jgi:hypothetical protein